MDLLLAAVVLIVAIGIGVLIDGAVKSSKARYERKSIERWLRRHGR